MTLLREFVQQHHPAKRPDGKPAHVPFSRRRAARRWAATAAALSDARRREAVGKLVDRLVRPASGDPLIALLERTAVDAAEQGLTEADIEAELAAYNAERRS